MYQVAAALHQTSLAVASSPDSAPPGIFLRLFIFGGLALVVLVGWLVLRGYRDTGGKKRN
jgi:hypothetical protein